MIRALLVFAALLVAGCSLDRAEQRDEQRVREETFTFDVPVPLLGPEGWQIHPITVTGKRTMTETRTGQVTARTEYHAPELGQALVASLRQAFPAAGLLLGAPPAPRGGLPDGAVWGPAGIGATGVAWAIAAWKNRGARRENDEAWDEKHEAACRAARAEGRLEALGGRPPANLQGGA